MVIEDAFFPQCPGGYLKQGGYGGGYGHSTAGYNFSDQSCYGTNTSTMKMARPNIATPEPAKHFVVDTGHGQGQGHDKSHGFSHQHHSAAAAGGTHQQQHGVDGTFGTTSPLMGGYMSGFGYPNNNNKPAFPFVGGGGGGATYEYERETYYGDGGMNRFQTMGMPLVYGMQSPPPPMHAAGFNHWAAGKGDAFGGSFTNSKGL